MNPSDAIEAIEKPLSSLPYSLSRHILEHLRKLTSHEPVIGIMGKSGAGKSSLCNALFQGEVTPVSDVHAGTREVRRFRLSGHGHSMVITDLPGVGESRDPEALTFSTTSYRELKMKTLSDTHVREVSRCPSPVTIWQTLLIRLLDQHYGLTLNDTPFADERVIEQHIEAGISLCDAVNFLVEKYALVRTDQPGFSTCPRSQLINSIDILRARRATGLMTRDNYRTVNNTTLGKYPEAK